MEQQDMNTALLMLVLNSLDISMWFIPNKKYYGA